ncbi:MAG: nitrogen regulation protein NR(II) [Bdellovibrionales bacterium]
MEEQKNRIIFVEGVKVAILFVLLLLVVGSQFLNFHFILKELLLPSFTALIIGFIFHGLFLLQIFKSGVNKASLFIAAIFDVVLITSIIYYVKNTQSLFVFLYLLNILTTGWLLKRKGAMATAIATSLCFSLLLAVGPTLRGQTLILVVVLNNFAFLAAAWIGGFLGEYYDKMGKKLQASQDDFRLLQDLNHLIIESMPSVFVSVDMLGRVLIKNNAAMNKLNIPEEYSEPIDKILPGIEKRYQELKYEFEEEGINLETIHFDFEIIGNDDQRRIFNVNASDIFGRNGVQIGRMYLLADLTKERELEKQVQRKEKLAAVGQLAAGIAHEIRNPLASMSGSIQFMKSNMGELSEDNETLMGIVLKETDRLNDLITEFMDFVKTEPNVNDKIDLKRLLEEIIEQIRFHKDVPKGIDIQMNLQTDKWIWGNEAKLRQVFLNLLINAVHAMEKTSLKKLDISSEYEKGIIRVKVKDYGMGMSDKVKARLFEPFHTTKAKGTGLGLATTHKILENHSAKVFVESEPEKGTTFTIEFTRLV